MKRIRDPIHDNIALDDNVIPLLDSPEVQRLRRIRQLGTANFVYPGANHTRFEHSLGVYHVAGLASRGMNIEKDEAEKLKIAALLHDIGHGPFSHVFEEIEGNPTNHEKRTWEIIEKSGIADIIRSIGYTPEEITAILKGKSPYSPLISSTIDVDRMDYLIRDAHYTGVKVGVDIDRITSVIGIDNGKITIRDIGLPVTEALLVTRFMMFSTVYLHHTTRAVDAALIDSMETCLKKEKITWEELWKMDDHDLFHFLKTSQPDTYKDLTERRLPKPLVWIPGSRMGQECPMNRIYRQKHLRKNIREKMAELLDTYPEDLYVDIPPPPLRPAEVYVKYTGRAGDSGTVVPITDVSSLVKSLDRSYAEHWEIRIFCRPERRKELAARMVNGKNPEKIISETFCG